MHKYSLDNCHSAVMKLCPSTHETDWDVLSDFTVHGFLVMNYVTFHHGAGNRIAQNLMMIRNQNLIIHSLL